MHSNMKIYFTDDYACVRRACVLMGGGMSNHVKTFRFAAGSELKSGEEKRAIIESCPHHS